jgi:hypothetical protein
MKKKTILKTTIKHLFIVLFACLLTPNLLNAQGANAPEAASFEPVDATDMVNLVTGDLSYVLPLLNVPSPEGGYPIALSYHAGIAMDQEASWVGLGWSLNPGAINRAVNGYPDDWAEANVSEFFYDKGWTNNYYSFSAGVTFKGTYSIGLGLSWGSNQSLGGFVSAGIGLGKTAGVGGSIGTNGIGINGSVNGFSASLSTNGIGIGYSGNKGSSPNLGVGLNYSYNGGLSGNVSVTQKNGTFNNSPVPKSTGIGISFSSQGASVNAKVNGYGAGVNISTQSINAGDYTINKSTSGFFIPAYIFYVGFSHTKINYSLFKYNNLYTSGMLYPVNANKLQYYDAPNNHLRSRRLEENHFMDTNIIQPFKNNSLYEDLVIDAKKNDRNNLILPNYDKYSVNAQGLTGTISPYTHNELNLSGRGRGDQNADNEYISYLNHDIAEYSAVPSSGLTNGADIKAIDKKYFTFSSAYTSFLRLKKSNLYNNGLFSATSDYLMKRYVTDDTFIYNNNGITNSGRKKEGHNIITYTNKEIRQGNISGFIDAKEYNNQNVQINLDRSNTNVFLDDGIGAFKITALDGKTYHYSLPVYQFESFYKNFRNVNGNGDDVASEDENFFEIQKDTPYATHWLLTAITGPDYVDVNSNGNVDEGDYGYWVEFDYGKWSDAHIWKTPVEEIVDKDDATKKTYSYSWGRKQLYYLDAIKTRTHTALFVKKLRDDNKSKTITKRKLPFNYSSSLTFDSNTYSKKYSSNKLTNLGSTTTNVTINHNQTFYPYQKREAFSGKKAVLEYLDLKEGKSLALDKIVLLKNSLVSNLNKGIDSLIGEEVNYMSKCLYYDGVKTTTYYHVSGVDPSAYNGAPYYNGETFTGSSAGQYLTSGDLKSYKSQLAKNILDVKDIENLNLENNATQIIEFEHDYSLANNSPNTSSGKLTLKNVNFKGKKGLQLVPPYKFDYAYPNISYNKNDIDDWGYHKNYPWAWSLTKITTPTGGKINILLEADNYQVEAAHQKDYFSDLVSTLEPNGDTKITFNSIVANASQYFTENNYYRFTFDLTEGSSYLINNQQIITNSLYDELHEVVEVGSNYIIVKSLSGVNLSGFNSANPTNCSISITNLSCRKNLKAYGSYNGLPSNGIYGGGVRTKSITINDGIKNIATTEYVYQNGITSYAPTKEQKGVPYVSELPSPMVMYSQVTMLNKDGQNNYLGKTEYEFETLQPRKEEVGYIFSLGDAFKVKEDQDSILESGKVIVNKFTIESKLGNLGRINSIISYNTLNQPLQISKNKYKKDLNSDNEIGVTQESHKSYKRLYKNSLETFYVSATSKISYPNALESTSVVNGGLEVTKHFDKHDFLTGQVLETRTFASDGTAFKTKLIPAYTKYSDMGSKVENASNKNMLTQQTASYMYLLDTIGNESIVSAGITTWNNNWSYTAYNGTQSNANNEVSVWRKHKSFVWDGALATDGTYAGYVGENDNFNWGVGASQVSGTKWKQVSEITRYDHYSAPLENKDINNNFASTKMGDNNSKVIAVANAPYTDMYYSGAEYIINGHSDYFDGEVKSFGRKLDTLTAHTGKYVVEITQGQHAFEVQVPADVSRTGVKEKFKVSVWVKAGQENNVKIKNGTTEIPFNTNESIQAGNWVLLHGYVTITSSGATIAVTSSNGTVELDDFRLLPLTSSMSSYVYNEFDEVTFITGSNGLSTKYIYDSAGRLKETLVEVIDFNNVVGSGGFKPVQKNTYNYKK